MPKMFTALNGISKVEFMPSYMYVDPTGSDIDAIILSGVSATPVMLLSAQVESETYVAADLDLIAPDAISAEIYSVTYVAAGLGIRTFIEAGTYSETHVGADLQLGA